MTLTGGGLLEVEFGQPEDQILGRLREVLGDETEHRATECGGGADRLIFWHDFYIVLDDGKFVGYSYGLGPTPNPRAGRLSVGDLETVEGLRVGDTVGRGAELYGQAWALDETSLGQEWSVDGSNDAPAYHGVIDETGRYLGSISAGDDCNFG